MMPTYPNAGYLAEADWLHEHIDDDDLCVIDARYDVRVREDGTFEEVSGHADYLAGHIIGARFVDLRTDLTNPADPASIIGPDQFAALMSHLGVGPRTTVVVYDDRGGVWAARLWWALRYYGHDSAKILNGGLSGWIAAGYELQEKIVTRPQSLFEVTVRSNLRVTKSDVLAAIDDAGTCIVDALPEPFYLGLAALFPQHRKGHVPGARNVPAESILDPRTARVLPMGALQELWRDAAIEPDQAVITYCGSGVFASFALFVLVLMGHDKVALYDASWMEWGADDELPVETGSPVEMTNT
jgi:thiosulfate/3-mercaptopyruvate sulfurtransferase